jgi:hypothetical protein
MTESAIHRAEVFLRFSRRSLVSMLAVVLVLGGTALSLMLSPPGAVGRAANLIWWLIPVAIAAMITLAVGVGRRRWNPDAPEVQMVLDEELRRTNLYRASRLALIATLAMQWPMAMAFAAIRWLPGDRMAMVMAASTITFGLVTLITSFLVFDRD